MLENTENNHRSEEIKGAVPLANFDEAVDICIEASFKKRLSRRAVEYRASRIDNMLFYDHPSEDKFVVEIHHRNSEEDTYEKKEYLSKDHYLQELQRLHELSMFRQNKFRMERISDLLENIADSVKGLDISSAKIEYFFDKRLKFIIDDIDRIATNTGDIAYQITDSDKD